MGTARSGAAEVHEQGVAGTWRQEEAGLCALLKVGELYAEEGAGVRKEERVPREEAAGGVWAETKEGVRVLRAGSGVCAGAAGLCEMDAAWRHQAAARGVVDTPVKAQRPRVGADSILAPCGAAAGASSSLAAAARVHVAPQSVAASSLPAAACVATRRQGLWLVGAAAPAQLLHAAFRCQ